MAEITFLTGMFFVLFRRRLFNIQAMLPLPTGPELFPVLKMAFALQMRTLSVSLLLLFATQQALQLGVVALAAHEILRQLWVFSMNFCYSFNITSQVTRLSSLALQSWQKLA